jgi:putative spermidine/putrescine transport system ATP-binding protein
MTLSDRICLMRGGRIEQVGSPRDLYVEPRSTYAADFLGESNLLAGTLDSEDRVVLGAAGSSLSIACTANPGIARGAAVRCFVRPEAIRLLTNGAAADNAFDATIEEIVLAGGVTRYSLALAPGVTARATVLTSSAMARHAVGDRVRVGFDRPDARVLPEDAA